jgi:hypothetical protein
MPGIKLARAIAPLDKDGNRSADGKIVFLSIGFSNPSMEFPSSSAARHKEPDINPHMVMVNGCVRSRASSEHTDPHSNYWNEVDQRLAAVGVTGRQVLTLWIKEVIPGAVDFPDKAKELTKNLTETFTWCTIAPQCEAGVSLQPRLRRLDQVGRRPRARRVCDRLRREVDGVEPVGRQSRGELRRCQGCGSRALDRAGSLSLDRWR